MKNYVCEELLLYHPTSTKYETLRSWYIVSCIFNAFFTITAIVFNSVTIQALTKTSSFPKPLKTLLLSLAVSDLGVGLLVQPFYFGILVKWLQRNNSTDATCTTFYFFLGLFSGASFVGVVALSVDRFMAIHLHLRYQELVTHKRVVALVISIWMSSALLSLIILLVPMTISYLVLAITGMLSLLTSGMLFFKIYLAVRRHRNQIHALQAHTCSQIANAARLRKSAIGTFYIYLVFLKCYLPNFCSLAVTATSEFSTGVKVFVIWSISLMLLNSSLNPVVYCWKMRHIRHAIFDTLRNVFPSHS